MEIKEALKILARQIRDMNEFDIEFIDISKEMVEFLYEALRINQERLEIIADIKMKIALGNFSHKVHSENYTLDEIIKALEECEVNQ